jgi:hypothetical protein
MNKFIQNKKTIQNKNQVQKNVQKKEAEASDFFNLNKLN